MYSSQGKCDWPSHTIDFDPAAGHGSGELAPPGLTAPENDREQVIVFDGSRG
jgi:hypothetical protein